MSFNVDDLRKILDRIHLTPEELDEVGSISLNDLRLEFISEGVHNIGPFIDRVLVLQRANNIPDRDMGVYCLAYLMFSRIRDKLLAKITEEEIKPTN